MNEKYVKIGALVWQQLMQGEGQNKTAAVGGKFSAKNLAKLMGLLGLGAAAGGAGFTATDPEKVQSILRDLTGETSRMGTEVYDPEKDYFHQDQKQSIMPEEPKNTFVEEAEDLEGMAGLAEKLSRMPRIAGDYWQERGDEAANYLMALPEKAQSWAEAHKAGSETDLLKQSANKIEEATKGFLQQFSKQNSLKLAEADIMSFLKNLSTGQSFNIEPGTPKSEAVVPGRHINHKPIHIVGDKWASNEGRFNQMKDKGGYKNLNEVVSAKNKAQKGSPEFDQLQNLINKASGVPEKKAAPQMMAQTKNKKSSSLKDFLDSLI